MATVTSTIYESWDSLKAKYPDSFVLLENPVFEPENSPFLKKGIFRYKSKSRKKVFEKAATFDMKLSTIQYTGGKREEAIKDLVFIL